MLGVVNPKNFKAELYAIYTFILIFIANVVFDLFALFNATGILPTEAELITVTYGDLLFCLKSTIAIYLANKGIQIVRRNSEGSK